MQQKENVTSLALLLGGNVSRNDLQMWYLDRIIQSQASTLGLKDLFWLAGCIDAKTTCLLLPSQVDKLKSEGILRATSLVGKELDGPLAVGPATEVNWLHAKYRIVFSLDLSPSMASLDPSSGGCMLDNLFPALQKCFLDLVKPINLHSIGAQIFPDIYVSVLAQCSGNSAFNKVLLQGCLLTPDNVHTVVRSLKKKLQRIENSSAHSYQQCDLSQAPDLRSALQNGVFALTLLPHDACSQLVLLTDGVSGMPDMRGYDSYAMLLNREHIACSIVALRSSSNPLSCQLGYIPDLDQMRFLAGQTGGGFITLDQLLRDKGRVPQSVTSSGTNVLSGTTIQRILLLKKLSLKSEQIISSRQKVREYLLPCHLYRIIDLRLQEGFRLFSVTPSTSTSNTWSLTLGLVWQPAVTIFYNVASTTEHAGPSVSSYSVCVSVAAPKSFQEQLSRLLARHKSGAAGTGVGVPLLKFICSVIDTDNVAAQLEGKLGNQTRSFQAVEDERRRVLADILPSLRSRLHRWLKTEKIELFLRPSRLPPDSKSYVSSREAILSLCREWATFTLDTSAFVRLLSEEYEHEWPSSFCLLRLSWESESFLVLHLAFFASGEGQSNALKLFQKLVNNLSAIGNKASYLPLAKQTRAILVNYEPPAQGVLAIPVPTAPLLIQYLWRKRWLWTLASPDTLSSVLHLLLRARYADGFFPISSSPTCSVFLKEITLRVSSPHASGRYLPCIVQYVVHHRSPNLLFTELWMEPQYGNFIYDPIEHHSLSSRQAFTALSNHLHHCDAAVIQGLCTFDIISSHVVHTVSSSTPASLAGQDPFPPHDPIAVLDHALQKAGMSVGSIISFATDYLQQYPLLVMPSAYSSSGRTASIKERQIKTIPDNDGTLKSKKPSETNEFSHQLDGINKALHIMLGKTLYLLSDIRLPTAPDPLPPPAPFPNLKGCSCYAKLMSNTRVVVALLPPYQSHMRDKFPHLAVHYYECSRENVGYKFLAISNPAVAAIMEAMKIEDPTTPTISPGEELWDGSPSLHASADSDTELPLTSGGHTLTSSATLYCKAVRRLYERNFVKAVYTALRDNIEVSPDDISFALKCCVRYSVELDVSEFLELQRLHESPSDELVELQSTYRRLLALNFQSLPHAGHIFFYRKAQGPAAKDATERQEGEAGDEGDGDDNEDAADSFWRQEEQFFTPGLEETGPPHSLDRKSVSIGVYPFPFFLAAECRAVPAIPCSDSGNTFATDNAAEYPETDLEANKADEGDSEFHMERKDKWAPLEDQLLPSSGKEGRVIRLVCITLAPLPLVGDSFSPPHFDEYTRQASGYGQENEIGLPAPRKSAADGRTSKSPLGIKSSKVGSQHQDDHRPPYSSLPRPLRERTEELASGLRGLLSAYALRLLRGSLNGKPSSVLTPSVARTLIRYMLSLPSGECTIAKDIPLSFLEPSRGLPIFLHDLTCCPFLPVIALPDEEGMDRLTAPEELQHGEAANDAQPTAKTLTKGEQRTPNPTQGENSQSVLFPKGPQAFLAVRPLLLQEDSAAGTADPSIFQRPWQRESQPSPLPDEEEKPASVAPERKIAVEYWLILLVSADPTYTVTVVLHAPGMPDHQVAAIMSHVSVALASLCKRTNQTLLLWSLHKTNLCSPLLDPTDGRLSSVPAAAIAEDPQRDPFLLHMRSRGAAVNEEMFTSHNYQPALFACPCVHTIHLNLHQRLDPDKAASALISTTLHHFAVGNKGRMFVFRDKTGRFFYLKLSAITHGSPSAAEETKATKGLSAETEDATGPGQLVSVSPAVVEESSGLLLEVHGLDMPGEEIADQLHHLLENKLASVTLSTVSALLLRNPLLKMSPTDLAFIQHTPSPQARLTVQIPEAVDGHHVDFPLYLLFLRQKLLVHLQTIHFLVSDTVMDPPDGEVPISANDFAFLYNHIPTPSPSKVKGEIGQGVACIYLRPLQANGDPATSLPRPNPSTSVCAPHKGASDANPPEVPESCDNMTESISAAQWRAACQDLGWHSELSAARSVGDPSDEKGKEKEHEKEKDARGRESLIERAGWKDAVARALPAEKGSRFTMEVWARGSISVSALMEHLLLCCKQTLLVYGLETVVMPRGTSVTLQRLSSCRRLLAYGHTLNSPAVSGFKAMVPLGCWELPQAAEEIRRAIHHLIPASVPQLYYHVTSAAARRSACRTLQRVEHPPPITIENKNNVVITILATLPVGYQDSDYQQDRSSSFPVASPSSSSSSTGSLPSMAPSASSSSPSLSSSTSETDRPPAISEEDYMLHRHVQGLGQEGVVWRRQCTVLVRLRSRRLSIYSYNWNSGLSSRLCQFVERFRTWNSLRLHLLRHVLNQKMGLFYSLPLPPSLQQTLASFSAPANAAASASSSASSAYPSPSPSGSSTATKSKALQSRGPIAAIRGFKRPFPPVAPSGDKSVSAVSGQSMYSPSPAAGSVPSSMLPTPEAPKQVVAMRFTLDGIDFLLQDSFPDSMAQLSGSSLPPGPTSSSLPASASNASPSPPIYGTPLGAASAASAAPSQSASVRAQDFHIALRGRHPVVPVHLVGGDSHPHGDVGRAREDKGDALPEAGGPPKFRAMAGNTVGWHGRQLLETIGQADLVARRKRQMQAVISQWRKGVLNPPLKAPLSHLHLIMQWARVISCVRIPFAFLERKGSGRAQRPAPSPHSSFSSLPSLTATAQSGGGGGGKILFLFQEPPLSEGAQPVSPAGMASPPWPRVMQAAFLDHYLAFLSHLGATPVVILQDLPRGGSSSARRISTVNPKASSSSVDYGSQQQDDDGAGQWQHYLHMPVHDGLMVVSLGIRKGLVGVEVYALPSSSPAGHDGASAGSESKTSPVGPGPSDRSERRDHRAQRGQKAAFARECSLLAARLRTAGAVYDFQVEQLQLFLQLVDAPAPPYPPHHFLRVLTGLCQTPPPTSAANAIVMQSLRIPLQPVATNGPTDSAAAPLPTDLEALHDRSGGSRGIRDVHEAAHSPLELFQYLCRYAGRYGLKTLERRGISPAVYFVPSGRISSSSFTHSVLCFAAPEIAEPRAALPTNHAAAAARNASFRRYTTAKDGAPGAEPSLLVPSASAKTDTDRELPPGSGERKENATGGREGTLGEGKASIREGTIGEGRSAGGREGTIGEGRGGSHNKEEEGRGSDSREEGADPDDRKERKSRLPLRMFVIRTRHSDTVETAPSNAIAAMLEDVLEEARKHVREAVRRAQEDLLRDKLWARLVAGEQMGGRLTDSEFALLMGLAGWRPIEDTDPALQGLLSPALPVPWAAVIRHLADIYPRRVALLSSVTHQHLLLFNPRDQDALLHVMHDTHRNTARIFAALRDAPPSSRISRSSSFSGLLTAVASSSSSVAVRLSGPEQEELCNLINLICIFLTRQLIGSVSKQ